jgi:DNA-directed RNA polymerase subunit RPC12/RpoP
MFIARYSFNSGTFASRGGRVKTIKAYKCEYCGKVFKTKKGCLFHENECNKNPAIKCQNCRHFEWGGIEKCDVYGTDDGTYWMHHYCKKLDTFIQSKKSIRKFGIDPDAIELPENCKGFEEIEYSQDKTEIDNVLGF